MAKKQVLHIITGLNHGGAEKVLYDLCTNSDQEIFTPIVISLTEKSGMLEQFRQKSIIVELLGVQKNPFSLIRALFKAHSIIKNENVYLIHAHMTHALIFSSLLKLFHWKLPLVFTPHSFRFGKIHRAWILFLLKGFRQKDILFSKEQYNYFLRKDFEVIPNGIQIVESTFVEEKFDLFTFLVIGRLEKVKNHLALIPIIRKLKEQFDFQLLIAGSGPLEGEIRAAIKQYKVEKQIILLGFRKDIDSLTQKSHVLLMSSLWEGLPISILEAGINGLPILSTPVGSIPSLIDEDTGYLKKLEDFEETMKEIHYNYVLAMNKAKALKQKIATNYNMDRTIEAHKTLYLQLIN